MKFAEFTPSVVPISVEDPVFPSVLEENFGALRQALSYIGQDLKSVKDVFMTLTAGEDLAAGDLVVLFTDGLLWKADATNETYSKGLLGIATQTILTGKTGSVLLEGSWNTTGLTVGSPYFVSTTGGEWTANTPFLTGEISRVIGYGLSATTLYFSPDRTWMEIA